MIRLLIKLPIFLSLTLGMVWAITLASCGDPERLLEKALLELARAYPDPAERELFLRDWGMLPEGLSLLVPTLGGRALALLRAGLLVSRLHAGALVRLFPVLVLVLGSGVVAGLISRERMRDEGGYASPTAAGTSLVLAGSGLFWLGLFALSPVPASYATLYVGGIVLGLGGTLYAANLPLKL
jgi:hypothetical protein